MYTTVFALSAGPRPSATKNWAGPTSFPFGPASFSSFSCLKFFKDEFRAGKFWNLNAKTDTMYPQPAIRLMAGCGNNFAAFGCLNSYFCMFCGSNSVENFWNWQVILLKKLISVNLHFQSVVLCDCKNQAVLPQIHSRFDQILDLFCSWFYWLTVTNQLSWDHFINSLWAHKRLIIEILWVMTILMFIPWFCWYN